MRRHPLWICVLTAAMLASAAHAAPLSRAQALAALAQPDAPTRMAGVERLGNIGSEADANRVLERLDDVDPGVRRATAAAVWQIWSRSGDPKIDKLFSRGVEQMQESALDDALTTFDEIVRRKPAFAEGWNKRATVYFLLGENEKSLKDCDEVLKRNPRHFGALSGAGQIHLQLGNMRRALDFFRKAVEVNPNLDGLARVIPLIEQRLRDDQKNRT
jgi:tetratricopeptide (TPR) repeat protein